MDYYRMNKYNEKISVEKYQCGTCKHYDFKDERDTNKCDKFNSYYPINDSCKNNWEEASDLY